jgi:hypothetical protein
MNASLKSFFYSITGLPLAKCNELSTNVVTTVLTTGLLVIPYSKASCKPNTLLYSKVSFSNVLLFIKKIILNFFVYLKLSATRKRCNMYCNQYHTRYTLDTFVFSFCTVLLGGDNFVRGEMM